VLAFAVIALVLAAAGSMAAGLPGHARTGESAFAWPAPEAVLRLVLVDGWPAALGLGLGLGGSRRSPAHSRTMLYDTGPWTVGLCRDDRHSLVVAAMAHGACMARLSLDPIQALRTE
jgi:hypothetical protein